MRFVNSKKGKAFFFFLFLGVFLPGILLGVFNPFFFYLKGEELRGLSLWYLFFFFMGPLFFLSMGQLFPRFRDGGYGLSRALGLFLLFFLNWILTSLGIMDSSRKGLLLCAFLTLLFSSLFQYFFLREKSFLSPFKKNRDFLFGDAFSSLCKIEILSLSFFFFFLIIQSYHPEIFWGEKPMDYSFINYNLRHTTLPLEDPWFSGVPVHYYYFGYYILGGMGKISGVSGELCYGLSLATILALLSSTLYSLLLYVSKRSKMALLGTSFLLLAGNFKSFFSLIGGGKDINFSYFWGNTRVFTKGGFAEYPSWSFLFADLHPHVMNYPYVALYLLFLFYCVDILWKEKWGSRVALGMLFLGFSYGAFIAINGWDFIIYSLFSCSYFLFSWPRLKSWRSLFYHFFSHLLGVLIFSPFLFLLGTGKKIGWSLRKENFNLISQHFLHHGHWWLIAFLMLIPFLLIHLLSSYREGRVRGEGLFSKVKSSSIFPLFGATLTLFFFAEIFILADRFNTTFKFITNIYILAGVIAVGSLRFFSFYLKRKKWASFSLGVLAIAAIVLGGSFFSTMAIIKERPFGHGKRKDHQFGLHGAEYMRIQHREDYKIISWINKHIKGTPQIIERYSPSFDSQGARIAMHTGLPTYLGWDHHVHLRGASWSGIKERKKKIDFVFTSKDPFKVLKFLLSQKINFIIVGNFERKFYPKEGLQKFSQNRDIFVPLVSSGTSTLYGIGGFKDFIIQERL